MTAGSGTLLETIAREARDESPLWGETLRPPGTWEDEPVFSPLGATRFALAIESIYEGYLLHYGRSRVFAPADADQAVLLGDYLYAHGLVRLARFDDVGAVADLAELISICSHLRAEAADGDGAAWAATSALLGSSDGLLERGRRALRLDGDAGPLLALGVRAAGEEPLRQALAKHARLAP